MAAVKTVSLTKEYSNGEHYLRAVDDISFTVEENEFVAIMGSSGCGKTTLLNLLGGLENPTHGCVYINDVDITQLSMEERSSFRRWHIGFIFQNFNLIPEMNVFENIVLPAKLMERNISKKEVMRIAEELEIEGFCQNPTNRCYICKKELFEKIWDIATKEGLNAVAEGSNMDDNGDYRPGLQAVAELGVKSPLRQSELYKADIRALSKDLGLPTWEKQSFACLSSRFVYGETITKEKLGMVDKAEQLLLDLGFHQLRVRIHGTLARIEVLPDELQKVLENRNQIVKAFKEYGFTYVTMDLQGYRMGSMNETLKK